MNYSRIVLSEAVLVLVLSEAVLVLSEAVLVLSEAVLVLESLLSSAGKLWVTKERLGSWTGIASKSGRDLGDGISSTSMSTSTRISTKRHNVSNYAWPV